MRHARLTEDQILETFTQRIDAGEPAELPVGLDLEDLQPTEQYDNVQLLESEEDEVPTTGFADDDESATISSAALESATMFAPSRHSSILIYPSLFHIIMSRTLVNDLYSHSVSGVNRPEFLDLNIQIF
jgi:hypothetical protein